MSQYSILVIDDVPDNFDVIEALLDGKDYDLYYASSGQEALNSIDKFDPDLILLDVMMPEMDGFEVCQRLKSTQQWQSVPIIMVTALSGKENLSHCLTAGADDFICKPIDNLELQARVKSMLRIKKQHDRIQSLSKLQRNNIHSLSNSLNEFRLDLAAGFPEELNLALNDILDNVALLKKPITTAESTEFEQNLKSISKAAMELEKIHGFFLFYLQLTLAEKDYSKDNVFNPKSLIQKIAIERASTLNLLNPFSKLVFDLENPEIEIEIEYFKYIVIELLDNAFSVSKPEEKIYVHGRTIDNTFHFWIDNQEIHGFDRQNSKLSELIRFNAGDSNHTELKISLKIVKKIIEIYDGLFLIANTDSDKTTIYVSLPLALSNSLKNTLVTTNSGAN